MKKILILLTLCICFACAHAETILLRTGARIKGTIVMMNDDVVVVRDEEGKRFQYPRAEVQEVAKDEEPEEDVSKTVEEEPVIQTSKRVSALLEIAGGTAVEPNEAVGGGVGVDLIIGSHHIANRHLLIGGGLGYHGIFLGGEVYHFLPIQAALRMPFFEAKHSPVFGVSIGYGVALSKNYTGGLYAGLDFGYRYQISERSALAVVFFARFQQAKVNTKQTIEGEEFVHKTGREFVTPGVKLALYF